MVAVFFLYSQDSYNKAIGGRAGIPTSVTFKYFFSGNTSDGKALEAMLGYGFGGWWYDYSYIMSLFFLIQKQLTLKDMPGLTWFAGVGGHLGYFYYLIKPDVWWKYKYYRSGPLFGLTPVVGLEYIFPKNLLPISLGVDFGLGPVVRIAPEVPPLGILPIGSLFGRLYFG